MDSGQPGIKAAVARAWANECGGILAMQLHKEREAISQGHQAPFNRERFEATARLFEEAGLSAEEHLIYRSTTLLSRCESTLWNLISACNPHWSRDDEEKEAKEHQKTLFVQPNIDRTQLEIVATKAYLRNLRSKPQHCKVEESHKEAREQINFDSDQEAANAREQATPQKRRKGNLREISADDIVKAGMSAKDIVSTLFQEYPERAGKKEREEWILDLQNAAHRASKNESKGELASPLRIHKRLDGTWHWVALTHKGAPGRHRKGIAHKGNQYGIINRNANQLGGTE